MIDRPRAIGDWARQKRGGQYTGEDYKGITRGLQGDYKGITMYRICNVYPSYMYRISIVYVSYLVADALRRLERLWLFIALRAV